MNNEGSSSIIFFGVLAAVIFLVIGGLTTKISRDSEGRNSRVTRLYTKLASLEQKSFDNCSNISEDIKCVTVGNLVIFQHPSKIAVYDAVSKANIANFIRKDKTVHYAASQEALDILALEFLEN